jgi:hypothetical protein
MSMEDFHLFIYMVLTPPPFFLCSETVLYHRPRLVIRNLRPNARHIRRVLREPPITLPGRQHRFGRTEQRCGQEMRPRSLVPLSGRIQRTRLGLQLHRLPYVTSMRPFFRHLTLYRSRVESRSLEVRCGIKQQNTATKKYVHMLNGTLCATERALCCIVENYQTPEVNSFLLLLILLLIVFVVYRAS